MLHRYLKDKAINISKRNIAWARKWQIQHDIVRGIHKTLPCKAANPDLPVGLTLSACKKSNLSIQLLHSAQYTLPYSSV